MVKRLFILLLLLTSALTSIYSIQSKADPINNIYNNWYGFAKNPMDSLSSWDSALTKAQQWKFTTVRLVIRYSTIDYNQLSTVLDKIASYNMKAIIDNHLLSQWVDVDPKFGSQTMRDFWVDLITHFKDNPTIIAWEIANEPFSNVWDNINVKSENDVPKEYAIITDLIREIDPNRPIIVMIPNNINPGSYLRDNWIISFHPYTYGDLTTQAEAQTILTYRIKQMDDSLAYGYSGAWIGEIECHPSGITPLNIEEWYVSQIINYGVSRGYGFNYWKYFNSHDDAGADPNEVISMSGYAPRPHVTGVTVYDTEGKIFTFNGWNVRDRYVDEDIEWLHDNGYTGVRLVLYWSTIERTEGNVDFSLAKQFLDACSKYHMWVWVDFHQWEYSPYFTFFGGQGGGFPAWLVKDGGYTNDASGQQAFADDFFLKRGYGVVTWEKYVDFMTKLCDLVKPYNNIFCIEPINEPMVGASHVNEARIACNARYTEIIQIIRGIIPDVIIMLHYIDSDYNQKQNFPNIIWTKSAYREYGAGSTESGIQTYLENRYQEFVVDMGVPYFISETGVVPSLPHEDADFFLTTLLTDYNEMFKDNGIGWNFWLYDTAPSSGGYVCPRTSDGSASWLQSIIAKNMNIQTEYVDPVIPTTPTNSTEPTSPINSTDTKIDVSELKDNNQDENISKSGLGFITAPPEVKNSFIESAQMIMDVLPIMAIFVGVGLFASRKVDTNILIGYALVSVIIIIVSSIFI